MKLNLLINPVTFNFLALKSSQILKIDKNIHFLLCTRNQQCLCLFRYYNKNTVDWITSNPNTVPIVLDTRKPNWGASRLDAG